ncbi:MAG: hypothetical protein Kow0042_17930 [Calditrichia bacterium]
MAGNLADGAAFSFFPTKPLTTGEGGMITTNSRECAQLARSLRSHGIPMEHERIPDQQNMLVRLGYNWRMSEIQAMIGYFQLHRLEEIISKRNAIAAIYRNEFSSIPGIRLIKPPAGFRHAYYKFPIVLVSGPDRTVFIQTMREKFGVQCGSIYYPPCHRQPFYREKFGYNPGDFPVAEKVLAQTVALPIYPDLKENEIDWIIRAVKENVN